MQGKKIIGIVGLLVFVCQSIVASAGLEFCPEKFEDEMRDALTFLCSLNESEHARIVQTYNQEPDLHDFLVKTLRKNIDGRRVVHAALILQLEQNVFNVAALDAFLVDDIRTLFNSFVNDMKQKPDSTFSTKLCAWVNTEDKVTLYKQLGFKEDVKTVDKMKKRLQNFPADWICMVWDIVSTHQ